MLHGADPFFRTFEATPGGCLAARARCLDITGEIAVFQGCAQMGDAAMAVGITVVPGAGFDVLPGAGLAAALKAALPAATSLKLVDGSS